MEFKCKVYDKTCDRVFDSEVHAIRIDSSSKMVWIAENPIDYENEIEAVILPSTGVKDINEKEVYKGDILRNRVSDRKWIVGYKDGAFILSWENRNIEVLFDYVREGILKDFEIIGNIYENEDMINKDSQ